MDEHLVPTLSIVAKWAASKHRIRRVWLYGSRVKGTHRTDSDLDVCVQIDPLKTEEEKELVQGQQKIWRHELSALCGMKVHLEPYATEQQKSFIAAGGELVYEREG
jgi:uncharacterized protein